ncbi:unnamed protein product [Rotaria sordida]|uniref:Uncharacterized protein n=2 Tax=Rotaria sordida TaxID=392033 RepID=A0A814L830_9BILA|nr:unnamed protein product [Rotaria sordida]
MSVINIVTCLHPKCCAYDPITETLMDTMLFDYPMAPCGYYCIMRILFKLDDFKKQLANIQTSIVELEAWYSHINNHRNQ